MERSTRVAAAEEMQNVIGLKIQLEQTYDFSRGYISQVGDDIHVGSPQCELSLPRSHCRQRNNKKERPVQLLGVVQVI